MNATLDQLVGSTAFDSEGSKLGKVGQIYLDGSTEKPTWASVNTGLFGIKSSFVPLAGARFGEGELHVQPSKTQVKDAPHLDEKDGVISSSQEQDLIKHYGIRPADNAGAATGTATGTGTGTAAGTATGGTHQRPQTDTRAQAGSTQANDDTLIRSEEQLRVAKQDEAAGKARLHKYVVTETEQVEVPVSHEEVHVERQPISAEEAKRLKGQATIGEADAEVALHAERVVVSKETVPVEKVHLGTETVTENQTVSEQVRKERIDPEVPKDRDRPTR